MSSELSKFAPGEKARKFIDELPQSVWDTPVSALSALSSESLEQSPKRIRSTDMVAQLVIDAETPITREQIHVLFESIHGIPEGWKNPANALNNAIARAVANGLIVELNGRYMSRDVAEHEELAENGGESDG